jgi:AcrR family transcriptional regulator
MGSQRRHAVRARQGDRTVTRRLVARREHRVRLLLAAQCLIREHGADAVSIERVCATAGVPDGAFHAVFADRTDCLLALFDDAADRLRARMVAAYGSEGTWVDRVRAALYEMLAFLDHNPSLARFMILGSLTGDPPMLARRARLLGELARGLEVDRPAVGVDSLSAPYGSDALVAAVAAILHGRLREGAMPCLGELGAALMGMLILPYLGVEAARRELSRPAPPMSEDAERVLAFQLGVL